MSDQPSDMAEAQPESPAPSGLPSLAAFGPDGSQIALFEFRQEGLFTLGNGLEATFQLDDPALDMKHAAFLLGEEGLLLQPGGTVTFQDRLVTRPLALAHGDTLLMGQCTFKLFTPKTAPFARARIGETLWTLRPASQDWQFAEDSGIMRMVEGGNKMENLIFNQDRQTEKSLDAYIDFQAHKMRALFGDFTQELLTVEPLYDCEEFRIALTRFTFQERQVTQIQCYGLLGGDVAIAVWSVPPAVGSKEEALARFRDYLTTLARFH
ncbi:hypothetical protein IV417_02980 [Alphaproteobacteria bacterium KMM 3653]|uniref:FHA domain-containing protein n=1 Tax=Harenicola maris TaxID=2841044 RepID=A0AAP2G7C5_9RHOB|nr:hypothetical protein [Harenicola maris]